LFFPKQLIGVQNNGCRDSLAESSDACVLYTSVKCEGTIECRYALAVAYEGGGPQQLAVGVPQHSVVKDGSFNYYYLRVRQDHI